MPTHFTLTAAQRKLTLLWLLEDVYPYCIDKTGVVSYAFTEHADRISVWATYTTGYDFEELHLGSINCAKSAV